MPTSTGTGESGNTSSGRRSGMPGIGVDSSSGSAAGGEGSRTTRAKFQCFAAMHLMKAREGAAVLLAGDRLAGVGIPRNRAVDLRVGAPRFLHVVPDILVGMLVVAGKSLASRQYQREQDSGRQDAFHSGSPPRIRCQDSSPKRRAPFNPHRLHRGQVRQVLPCRHQPIVGKQGFLEIRNRKITRLGCRNQEPRSS